NRVDPSGDGRPSTHDRRHHPSRPDAAGPHPRSTVGRSVRGDRRHIGRGGRMHRRCGGGLRDPRVDMTVSDGTGRETDGRVHRADKGYCGTSGPTASGGNNLWYLPPGPERAAAVDRRHIEGGLLSDPAWMHRVLDETYRRVDDLAVHGRYPFGVDPETGRRRGSSVQGAECMRRMRRLVHRAGVRILDQSPALQLLVDTDGAVAGATGVHRRQGYEPWTARAGAVVLATGGCAFLSGSFGTDVDTGDGHLMAAEAGA